MKWHNAVTVDVKFMSHVLLHLRLRYNCTFEHNNTKNGYAVIKCQNREIATWSSGRGIYVDFLFEKAMNATNKNIPAFGSSKGMVIMSDDFDEPHEDFKEYM